MDGCGQIIGKRLIGYIYTTKLEPKHLECLLVEGCNSVFEIPESVLICVHLTFEPFFPICNISVDPEKKGCNVIQMA